MLLAAIAVALFQPIGSPRLDLPARPAHALTGSAFAHEILTLPLRQREDRIWREVTSGNVPDFLRRLAPVDVHTTIGGRLLEGRFFATADYLAVGSDDDYLLMPMTPYTAQRLADRLHCLLPTPAMVDAIHAAATVRLDPAPIPPSAAMTTVAEFVDHSATVRRQRDAVQAPLGALVAGDKKDIVICRALASTPGHVAIYGWHRNNGRPIQPLYLGHLASWADYSHGVRLIADAMTVDGESVPVAQVLADPTRCGLLSNEGPVDVPRYHFSSFPETDDATIKAPPDEVLRWYSPMPGVRVLFDEPKSLGTRVRLVLYALPNGNTIEETFGRRPQPGEDWRDDIQQIGAQTRFVRREDREESVVVAYLEAAGHAWPAWLRTHPGAASQIYRSVTGRYVGHELRVALDSHSGGGALELAIIDALPAIPAEVDRIAFLDSDYAYTSERHAAKLEAWLKNGAGALCVIAYDDASARLDGRPFVSAQGGTWGRSHAMLADLRQAFEIRRGNTGDPERYEGLGGRIVFLLKENPRGEIFHTVQVERNGFIESLLSGSPEEGRRFTYFGERAYSDLIGP